eukprot:10361785-Karenia_brevis.AAC.1
MGEPWRSYNHPYNNGGGGYGYGKGKSYNQGYGYKGGGYYPKGGRYHQKCGPMQSQNDSSGPYSKMLQQFNGMLGEISSLGTMVNVARTLCSGNPQPGDASIPTPNVPPGGGVPPGNLIANNMGP